jgi:glycosyltransferase involved in cell wall biosynthesis
MLRHSFEHPQHLDVDVVSGTFSVEPARERDAMHAERLLPLGPEQKASDELKALGRFTRGASLSSRIHPFPIDWPEPFGLVMIEAIACGTPVIAYRSMRDPAIDPDGAASSRITTMLVLPS